MAETLTFLSRFLTNPLTVGAVAPSSDGLACCITSWIDWPRADVVVEYGPGTGVFTNRIRERLKSTATFLALERDPVLCDVLRRRFPELQIYCDSVADVGRYLNQHGVAQADAIICGLPWASFRSVHQDEFMRATLEILRPGGQFVTFAYLQGLLLPSGRRFRRRLHEHFSTVSRSPVVWRNLPPAFVYQCTR